MRAADLAVSPASQRVAAMFAAPWYYDRPYPYYGGFCPADISAGRLWRTEGGRPLLVALSPVRFDERHLSGPRWPTDYCR
jgi:hypothetical protein